MSSEQLRRTESLKSGTEILSETKQLEIMATATAKLMSMVVKK
jgi:hypothetical protein